jgi:hypothetical protein
MHAQNRSLVSRTTLPSFRRIAFRLNDLLELAFSLCLASPYGAFAR